MRRREHARSEPDREQGRHEAVERDERARYEALLGIPAWRSRVPRWLARFLFEPPDVIPTRRPRRFGVKNPA